MSDAAAPSTWLQRLTSPRSLAAAAVGLLVGLGAAFVGQRVLLRPKKETARRRYETTRDVMRLYGLQLQYKKEKGVYANGLDSLLSVAPDAAALKAGFADHLDTTTLEVDGNAASFRIEANVLDADRTLVKIKGPVPEFPTRRPAPVLAPTATSGDSDGGAPVLPPSGR
ncbi:MAG: hypothetical protein KGM24_10105 [Elusimicrobia bacterium]|nr:hypothetical protein [Elusimicrobiota bacterium]